jgi:PhoD-like phosphatase
VTDLVLGPLLRHVGDGCASVWVEVDGPCEVRVLDHASPAFQVAGHWYALVVVEGLPERAETPYEVHLDGERVWPLGDDWPDSVISTRRRGDPVRLAFGSCRVAGPLDDEERGVDALHALAVRMRDTDPEQWPDELLLVGDQVYADENISPETSAFIAARRDTSTGAGPRVEDYEEYTRLYRESWSPAPIRWLLSTVPSAMVFDDHDVHDDWNTSGAWREEIKKQDWWQEHIESALMSYWVYQHLGNLGPAEVRSSELLAQVREADDGSDVLRAFARKADAEADGGGPTRWSYVRDLGGSLLVVIDSRCGRVVGGDRRNMLDDPEWEWLGEQVCGDVDHLLIATSLPYLLPPGVHHLEAWDEAVAGGVWGRRAARFGEKLRQGADLEHWAAFGTGFRRMSDLVASVGSGERGRAPATITFLSGDVHFAYLAEGWFPASRGVSSRVFQAVCSPLRNPLPPAMKVGQRLASSGMTGWLARGLARLTGVDPPELRWQITGPAFGNEVATVELDGRSALLTVEKAVPGPQLAHSFTKVLS